MYVSVPIVKNVVTEPLAVLQAAFGTDVFWVPSVTIVAIASPTGAGDARACVARKARTIEVAIRRVAIILESNLSRSVKGE